MDLKQKWTEHLFKVERKLFTPYNRDNFNYDFNWNWNVNLQVMETLQMKNLIKDKWSPVPSTADPDRLTDTFNIIHIQHSLQIFNMKEMKLASDLTLLS